MNISDLFINENITIKEAIKKLDETAKKILLVTEDNKLKGIVTDGDIRRWILKNGSLQEAVIYIMNTSPKYIYEKDIDNAKEILMEKMVEAMPVVNAKKEVVDIVFWNDNFGNKLNHFNKLETPVVIMAGGKGTRLEPYTKILPKPLIPIGDTPIVERIINRFNEYGCDKFYMTVNYKKNMIKAYFNELDKAYEIEYVEEEKLLGTAGSLSLLKVELKDTFFVSNCDILIDANYSDMIKCHRKNNNKITLVTSLKHYTIPYGIIEISESSEVESMIEKPEYDYLVNTGMYILEPEVLKDIPEDTFYHITDLINKYIDRGEKIGVYPVSDKEWLDMGQFKEMENMFERLGIK
ncbi:nucleotidyltransferase family protein [Alkaliphilus sp. MSJ-5]|uniref:Nucleotidyltransferase family protein n=1 Tax=Alkaliphilus flagellatus TaxID=2841507 RepID=A0ABS6G4X9_9FIRM|nr:nucleotidyltransferase family protein [Alkaliphilus flagellatus]MBU5676663.1 nucleotidyltransferase family protein [Alkaliphilus flagellatus]